MNLKKLLIVLLFVNYSLCAKGDERAFNSTLANFGGVPSAIVGGCVNVITGDYCDFQVDVTVPGPEPLTWERSHISSSWGAGDFCPSWDCNHISNIELATAFITIDRSPACDMDNPVKRGDQKSRDIAIYKGPHGERLTFVQDHKDIKYYFDKGLMVTNCGRGEISALTNIKKYRYFYPRKTEKGFVSKLVTGGGDEYFFRGTMWQRLEKIEKRNRLNVIYNYEAKSGRRFTEEPFESVEIQNKEGQKLSKLELVRTKKKHLENHPFYYIKTEDGRTVQYTFKKKKFGEGHAYLLKHIDRPNAPRETYEYEKAKNIQDRERPRVVSKTRPEGRYQQISYYKKGHNEIHERDIKIKSREDDCYNRVATITEPLGTNSDPVIAYQLLYNVSKKTHEGVTDVYDALNQRRQFFFTKNRLTHINHYKGTSNHQNYRIERFFWGKEGYEGYLTNRSVDEEGKGTIFSHTYRYDTHGNILVDKMYGRITGTNDIGPQFDGDGEIIENGCDCYVKHFKYNEEYSRYNLLAEEEDYRSRSTYKYLEWSNLIYAKFISDKEKIRIRNFYDYDVNGMVIREITDNGSGEGREDLTDVTERQIKEYIRYTTFPVSGVREAIHKYLDLNTMEEVLLKRIVYTLTIEGYKTREDLYNANNELVYVNQMDIRPFGKPCREVNALGEVTLYRYDENENLIYEQGPQLNGHKEFYYDFKNRLVREEQIYTDGRKLALRYQYDRVGNCIKKTDVYGNETCFEYDAFGQVVKTIMPETYSRNGVAQRVVTETEYDVLGNACRVVDGNGNVKRQRMNINGQPLEIIYPNDSKETFEYYIDGLLKKETAKNGSYTTYKYDFLGRLTKKELFSPEGESLLTTVSAYDAFHLISEFDALGVETYYFYDFAGRLSRKVKGVEEELYEYDALGRLVKVIKVDNNGNSVHQIKEYDLLDRVVEERVEMSDGTVQMRKQYSYDCNGNRMTETEFFEHGPSTTSYEYNAGGDPVKKITADGLTTFIRYNYGYKNAYGQFVGYCETIDPMGNISVLIKDSCMRDACILRKNLFGNIIQKTEFEHDGNGNKVRRVDTVFEGEENKRQVVTEWAYDQNNQVVRTIEALGEKEQKTTEVKYDLFGQKEQLIKSDGTILYHVYDLMGMLVNYVSSDGTINYSYEYDRLCHPLCIRDNNTKTETIRRYDDNGRIIEEALSNGLKVCYEHDRLGRVASITLPDGTSITYGYKGNNLSEIHRLDALGEEKYVHSYLDYDCAGKSLLSRMIGNIGCINYRYDGRGRVLEIATDHWSEKIAEFDAAGNLTERKIIDAHGEITDTYAYDDLYQLVGEKGFSEHSYRYDSLNNRLQKDGDSYQVNSLNQLLNDSNTTYSYDQSGNVIRKVSLTEDVRYEFDALNRLTSVAYDDVRVDYIYDSFNRRVSATVSRDEAGECVVVDVQRFLYLQDKEIGAYTLADEPICLRVLGTGFGAEIGAAVALEISEEVFAPIHDHNGNVACVVDIKTGVPYESYRYTAYGEETVFGSEGQRSRESSINPWRFCSKRYDPYLKMVYFGQRYYDPRVGRWNTPDPIGQRDGPNLYAYLKNNPMTNLDLWGLCCTRCCTRGGPFSNALRQHVYNIRSGIGNTISMLTHHIMPIPIIRDALKLMGNTISGYFPSHFVPSHREPHSSINPLEGVNIGGNTASVTINGICNKKDDSIALGESVSKSLGGAAVSAVHNAEHGFMSGILQAAGQKNGLVTNSVKVAMKAMRDALDSVGGVGGGGKVFIFAHSQGGAITDAALRYGFTAEERKMFEVYTFGSATMISSDMAGVVQNFVSKRDAVPFLTNPITCAKAMLFGSDNIKFLESTQTPFIDHAFNNPTYQEALKNVASGIMDRYRSKN